VGPVSRVRTAVLVMLLMAAQHLVAFAQTPQQRGFEPISDIPKETLPAGPLIFSAYGFVWVALTVYVFLLWRRLGRVEHELADVNARLANRK
jgi:CcmD family protein